MFLLKILPQIIAWIAALWGIWTGADQKKHIKIIASGIASAALVVSIILTVIDAREVERKERIQDMFLFANTPVQQIDIRWEFSDVSAGILQAFKSGDELEEEFWENFDWSDTPDDLMERAFHVEYRVQPLINAIATGSNQYPYLGSEIIKADNKLFDDYESPQQYMLFFPMNVSLTESLELGKLTSSEQRGNFEQQYDVIPYPAPKYDYHAKAEKRERGFTLAFSRHGSAGGENTITAPSIYGFNIVLPDVTDRSKEVKQFFLPESYQNMYQNIEIDREDFGTWRKQSRLTLILNNIKERPLVFDVSYIGQFIHAPMHTDEDLPHGEYTFSIYKATYTHQ